MAYTTTAARLGGIGGIVFVLSFFRSYLTPPDAPVPTSAPNSLQATASTPVGEVTITTADGTTTITP